MKNFIITVMLSSLSGCAGVVGSIKVANDDVIATWSTAACATPLSAAVRNPQVVPALKVLCPGVDASGLLSAEPKK